jgi:hypothetical protein
VFGRIFRCLSAAPEAAHTRASPVSYLASGPSDCGQWHAVGIVQVADLDTLRIPAVLIRDQDVFSRIGEYARGLAQSLLSLLLRPDIFDKQDDSPLEPSEVCQGQMPFGWHCGTRGAMSFRNVRAVFSNVMSGR